MEALPFLDLRPRVDRDIEECLDFINRQPWGKPNDRLRDIYRGIAKVWRDPTLCPVRARAPSTGLELRRRGSAQFVIIYAYRTPDARFPQGIVSIRAVRHRRVRNVFAGVRETDVPAYSAPPRLRCHASARRGDRPPVKLAPLPLTAARCHPDAALR